MKNNADLFDHVQSRIRKPDLPFAMQDQSKANEESILSNGNGCFIFHPIMGSLQHVLGSQSLITSVRANVEAGLLFNLFDFDLT